jgi:hypothetical protein
LLIFRNWDDAARYELTMCRDKEAKAGMKPKSIIQAGDNQKHVDIADTAFDFLALADTAITTYTKKNSKGVFVVDQAKLNKQNANDVSQFWGIQYLILYV